MEINRLNIDCNAIYAVGDIHGYFDKITEMIINFNITNSCIIVCGDCGLGFNTIRQTEDLLSNLDYIASENNNYIVMLRGNHDNPSYFNHGYINTKHIIAVPDYTILNDYILLVGGAISIDRTYRIKHDISENLLFSETEKNVSSGQQTYWSDEAPVFDEDAMNSLIKLGIKIKHVVTHTCPSFCDPRCKDGIEYWLNEDSELENDLDSERNTMDKLWNRLVTDTHPLKTWTYGHYHRHSHEDYEGVKFTMLDAIINRYSDIDWVEIKD